MEALTMTANTLPILSDDELETLSAPLSLPLSFSAWAEAEEVARAFSEDETVDAVLSDAETFLARRRVADRVRRAVESRPENVARGEREREARMVRAVVESALGTREGR